MKGREQKTYYSNTLHTIRIAMHAVRANLQVNKTVWDEAGPIEKLAGLAAQDPRERASDLENMSKGETKQDESIPLSTYPTVPCQPGIQT